MRAKKLQGISDVKDLTDRSQGLRLVIEIKNGFHPEAVLEELYRLTPMEETFGINNVCLVDGQPRTLGLRELLAGLRRPPARGRPPAQRRTAGRKAAGPAAPRRRAALAMLDIDEVIQVIRSSDDTAEARDRLMAVFDLSEIQTNYILDMPLRRLTRFSRLELERSETSCVETIAALTAILDDDALLRGTVSERARRRRQGPLGRRGAPCCSSRSDCRCTASAAPLEVADDPCHVLLSSTGLLARTAERRAAARARVRGPRTTRSSPP